MKRAYDVVVIGGGHAGTEAAAAAARMGAETLLLTQRLDKIGELSCNPSIGGIGKSHLVREIDALDGLMARAADQSCIHNKLLNRSKGPAVQGTRVQASRQLYKTSIQKQLANTANLDLCEGEAVGLVTGASGQITGVTLISGLSVQSKCVIVATGTFLRGRVHIGHQSTPAGRMGELPAIGLAECLDKFHLPLGRLKTGTPPRLAKSSIDWASLPEDRGDEHPRKLSFMAGSDWPQQIECRITGTTLATHDFIRRNLDATALYGGGIAAKGPRYCPSIEDKVVRFADKSRHQIFLEPEDLPGTPGGEVIYPNGISTSLPRHLQTALLKTIPGLDNAVITQPGYAIEYDFVQPTALMPSLMLRDMPGLFLAGQINGTTGYEEAAAQGILAGINAAAEAAGQTNFIPDRTSSYIGVMVDDLITSGVTEPYRMFTSRAEYRLRLRCDNADLRLTPNGLTVGCVSPGRATRFLAHQAEVAGALERSTKDVRTPSALEQLGVVCPRDGVARSVLDLFRQGTPYSDVSTAFTWLNDLSTEVVKQIEIEALYAGYIRRQDAEIRQFHASRSRPIPDSIDYNLMSSISTEAKQALNLTRPSHLGELAQLECVTPAEAAMASSHVKHRHP